MIVPFRQHPTPVDMSMGRPSCKARRRRGVSIIETIVLMTGAAIILGLCVIMLQLMMRLDADTRTRLDLSSATAKLARQLRRDAHVATAARVSDPAGKQPARLRLELGGGKSVEYQMHGDDELVRMETGPAAIARREVYRLPRSGPLRLELKELDAHRFAAITLQRRSAMNRDDPSRPFEILAQVGRNASSPTTADQPGRTKP